MIADQRSIFDDPLLRAKELKARRRYDAALQILMQALEHKPDDRKLKASLADLYFRMNRPRQALAQAGAILREDPNDPRALVVMGNALLARDEASEALEYFELAIQVAPTDYLWGRVARCHLALKAPRAALEALNKAESYAQPSPRLLGLRATCFRQLGESEGERQALLRAARTAPQDPQAFFTHVWPMVQDLTPLDGAGVAEILRESPDQTNNPHLLLFEAEGLIKSRRSDEARDRLERLDATQPPESVKAAADELKKRLPPAETEEKEP